LAVKTILVVDDELANAEVLALILGEEGYRTHCATDGREGLRRAQELRPDLIVLDYMMPILDGAATARALRENPATRSVRILMNSSLTEAVVRRHTTDYDAFLRKPYGVELALRTIARLLGD